MAFACASWMQPTQCKLIYRLCNYDHIIDGNEAKSTLVSLWIVMIQAPQHQLMDHLYSLTRIHAYIHEN